MALPSSEATYYNMGMPHPFMPAASLGSCDDSSFQTDVVDKVTRELSGAHSIFRS
jgi:hypothetical protein